MVVVIISNEECGVDIEFIDSNRDMNKIASRILSDKELLTINNQEDIFRYWTIKEAYFKKLSTGILLSNLNKDNDYSKVISIKQKDSLNNNYYLSYISDDNDYSLKFIDIL